MQESDAYSRRQWVWAVNLSGFFGWLAVSIPIIAGFSLGSFTDFFGSLAIAVVVGLPIAFATSWIIVAPILKRIMRYKISWIRAGLWGGVISFLIALACIAIGRFQGWLQSLDPSTPSQLGGGDKIIEVDGILTMYGWLLLAQSTAIFIVAGVLIALLIRAFIDGGRNMLRTDT